MLFKTIIFTITGILQSVYTKKVSDFLSHSFSESIPTLTPIENTQFSEHWKMPVQI